VQPAIEAGGLVKRFGEKTAVAGIDFQVGSGEIFGFLGPNGAGKTTTINMLTGLARPDAGTIRIGGLDCTGNPKAAQHITGVVPDESNLYPELTGFENLCFCGALYGMRRSEREARAKELVEFFGIAEAAGRKFAACSKGMKRAVTIAASIKHRPPILFLDEPTTGIDVSAARQIRRFISGLREAGTTIFLTTHYIEEAERLCDRIAFIVSGRIVRTDSVTSLLQMVQGREVMDFALASGAVGLCERVATAFPQLQCQVMPGEIIRITSSAGRLRAGEIVRYLEDHGGQLLEARRVQNSLEEVFVRITGIEAGVMKNEKAGRGS